MQTDEKEKAAHRGNGGAATDNMQNRNYHNQDAGQDKKGVCPGCGEQARLVKDPFFNKPNCDHCLDESADVIKPVQNVAAGTVSRSQALSDIFGVLLGRLARLMGNPPVIFDEDGSIAEALLKKAKEIFEKYWPLAVIAEREE